MYAPNELHDASDDIVRLFRQTAQKYDIVISEVGAWDNNPIHPDAAKAAQSIKNCQTALADADRIGALCAVNIVGSRNPNQWDGPHPDNLSRETFDAVVETTRKIVDGVKPKNAKYVLETMPWIFPDSPESYIELLKAIDRDTVGVHLDIANMVNSPSLIFNNTAFINHCFDLLGDKIIAIHAKELIYRNNLTFHIDEVVWGQGVMDIRTILKRANALPADVPIGLEHMPFEDYAPSIEYIRKIAQELHIKI